MIPIARLLVIIGVILIAAGGLIFLAARFGLPLGRLPGDIRIERGGLTCVIALGTSILLSVILTLALNLLARFLNK
jgi:hypothetical protein